PLLYHADAAPTAPRPFPTRRSSDLILPTSGSAKFFQVLNEDIFTRKMSVISYTKDALLADGADIVRLAESEGLTAHANARSASLDRKSTRLNSSHVSISYAVLCLKI